MLPSLPKVVPVSSSDWDGLGWTWWDQAWGQWDPQTSSQNAAWGALGASCLGCSRSASWETAVRLGPLRQGRAHPSQTAVHSNPCFAGLCPPIS